MTAALIFATIFLGLGILACAFLLYSESIRHDAELLRMTLQHIEERVENGRQVAALTEALLRQGPTPIQVDLQRPRHVLEPTAKWMENKRPPVDIKAKVGE